MRSEQKRRRGNSTGIAWTVDFRRAGRMRSTMAQGSRLFAENESGGLNRRSESALRRKAIQLRSTARCAASADLVNKVCWSGSRLRKPQMLTLYSYPTLFGVADNNAYGLKVFAFLRLAGVPFRHEHIFDAAAAPRAQLPISRMMAKRSATAKPSSLMSRQNTA
jgi:hypothetical protein